MEGWFKSMESADPSVGAHESAQIRQRSWSRLREHVARSREQGAEQISTKRTGGIGAAPAWAIAAALLTVIVSTVFLIAPPPADNGSVTALRAAEKNISNDTQEVMEVLLGDGSHVFLRPQSSLSFREPFDDAERVVALEGEALFSVARDTLRPFLVNTNEVVTKVLGTRFTVSAFPDEDNITVAVMSGKVSVITKKHKTVTSAVTETILTPNQKIIYNKRDNIVLRAIVQEPAPVLPADVVKRMHFEAAPIKEIFHALEQVYGVDIEFDENIFSSCILTTSIGEGGIYNRLDMICKAIDARYTIRENHIVITGAGCNP